MNTKFDRDRVAAAFHRGATDYDRHVLVQKRVVGQVVSMVTSHLPGRPRTILDVGTGTGTLLEQLHHCFPEAALTGVDIALNMCHHARQKLGMSSQIVNGTAEKLPFQDASFEVVVSASALQWVSDLAGTLAELRRVTAPGGLIALAFFCQGTLAEMQECIAHVAGSHGISQVVQVHRFRNRAEVQTIVDSLDVAQAHLTVETEVDWYTDLFALLRSIKAIGAGAATKTVGGLGWRGVLTEASEHYRRQYAEEGRIPATYKVLYLVAQVS